MNGIEILIQVIAPYRKKQPETDLDTELLENACIAMSSCISFSVPNMTAFLDAQGVELIIRCVKERVHAGGCGLKLLDFFDEDQVYKQGAERVVTASGLKFLFPIFLGNRIPKPWSTPTTPKAKREWFHSIKTQTVRIFYALALQLDDSSPEDAKARFLAKFAGEDMKYCDRLVELLFEYDERVRKAEFNFYRSSDVDESLVAEDDLALAVMEAKLKAGGDVYYRVGAITAYVAANSKKCHERILSQLHLQQSGISLIKGALIDFRSSLKNGRQKQFIDALLDLI